MHQARSCRKKIVCAEGGKDRGPIRTIEVAKKFLRSLHAVREQSGREFREFQEVLAAERDDRVIGPHGKKVRKQNSLPYPQPALGKNIGRISGGLAQNVLSAKDAAFGAFFRELFYQLLVIFTEEGPCLVLQIGIMDARVPQERVLAHFHPMLLRSKAVERVQDRKGR